MTKTTPKPSPKFTVVAGRYEQGYSDDENIKFISPELPFEEAFDLLKKHQPNNPSRFAFMEYDGYRMTFY